MKVSDLHLTPNEHIKHKKIFFFTGEFNGSSPPERVKLGYLDLIGTVIGGRTFDR